MSIVGRIEKAMNAARESARQALVCVELYWDAEVRQCTGREWRRVAAIDALVELEKQARAARQRLIELAPGAGSIRPLSASPPRQ